MRYIELCLQKQHMSFETRIRLRIIPNIPLYFLLFPVSKKTMFGSSTNIVVSVNDGHLRHIKSTHTTFLRNNS